MAFRLGLTLDLDEPSVYVDNNAAKLCVHFFPKYLCPCICFSFSPHCLPLFVLGRTESGTFVVGDFKINQAGFCFPDQPQQQQRQAAVTPLARSQHQHHHPQPTLPIAASLSSSACSSTADAPSAIAESFSSEQNHESSSSLSSSASRVQVQDLDELRATANLGQGASGVVQRVLHVPSGTALALKVVNVTLDAAQNEKKVRHLITELRTLHLSACPNIVSFHGAFYKEGAVYLCLEYMDFGSLADLLKMASPLPLADSRGNGEAAAAAAAAAEDEAGGANGPGCIPERMIATLARQVLVGLAYLHNVRRLIHRDIKPSNLLLNSRGQCKIADFGVSGQIENETMDAKSSFVGTVTYMSVRLRA